VAVLVSILFITVVVKGRLRKVIRSDDTYCASLAPSMRLKVVMSETHPAEASIVCSVLNEEVMTQIKVIVIAAIRSI